MGGFWALAESVGEAVEASIHHSLLGSMSFPAPVSFRDLCTFVFSDHALKLNHELVLRAISRRRLQINNGNAASRKLFAQQDLIGVLTAEPVGRVDQRCQDLSLRCYRKWPKNGETSRLQLESSSS